MTHIARLTLVVLSTVATISTISTMGCREYVDYGEGEIEFEPQRPTADEPGTVEPYAGDNPIVLEAQSQFATGLELHQKVIWRTCTPNGGVCHNRKEYPDLRTPAEFASAFGAACNIQPGEPSSVFDGCERPGDRIVFDGWSDEPLEVAWIERILGEDRDYGDGEVPEDAPGLHIHLAQPLQSDRDGAWSTGNFTRTFVDGEQVKRITYDSFQTRWYRLGDGTHIFGRIHEWQQQEAQDLLALGIVQGDLNRNGILGATLGQDVALLAPGRPEDSYLIARIRGEMHDAPIPGSRMPLANPPLSVPEMLALFCLVEGFPAGSDQTFLSSPIDYRNCSYSDAPEELNLLGEGVTWTTRVQPILEANCGGCHSEQEAQGQLVLVGEGVYARLLQPSTQLPELNLIEPGNPDASYLYLKLTGDTRIVGATMPYNPLTGEGRLTEAELGDISTWIAGGAVENE